MVCFDIGNLPKQVRPTMMFLVLDYVYAKMKKDLNRKLLIIDEAWSLLSRTSDSNYIFEIVKTCRKFNLGLFLINQEVEDMLNSKAGRSVLANSSYNILLRQKPAVIDVIQKTFHLSDIERIHLLTASIGEGILIMEDDHSKIKIVASDKEHSIITTNADEILSKNNKEEKIEDPTEKKSGPIRFTIDEEKGLFKKQGLSNKDINYLISKGYKEYIGNSIFSNKPEKFLLRTRFNENQPHAFMIFEIAEYLKKNNIKYWLKQTKEADIIFIVDGKKLAIEVETGSALTYKHVDMLKEKAKRMNKTYRDNWFFLVTDKGLGPNYSKLGLTTDKRYILSKLDKILKESKKSHQEK